MLTLDDLFMECEHDIISLIGDEIERQELNDRIFEIVDDNIPTYNEDRIEVFLSDSDLWFVRTGNGATILDEITMAIYDAMEMYINDHIDDWWLDFHGEVEDENAR